MAPIAQRPRGTQDLLPDDQPYWDAMRHSAQRLASSRGYQRIETPIFEPTELFTRSAGETTDVVNKEMYTFLDRGGRSMTLRPEGTAPVVRAYFDGGLFTERQPVRLFYLGSFFRYDRPQAGRFRQFHQFGVEVLGAGSPRLDVEIIALAWQWFGELGIKGISLQLNSIGDSACRPGYRAALLEYFQPYISTLPADDQARFRRNPLRLLDSKEPQTQELREKAPRSVQYLCRECAEAFDGVRAGLEKAGIRFTLNPWLVRGLDYYTRTAFEYWHESLGGAQNSIGGGGRYDGLAAELGYRDTPGTGFALGLERTAELLRQSGPAVYAMTVTADAGLRERIVQVASGLLQAGLAVEVDTSDDDFGGKIKRAARRRARLDLIGRLAEDGSPMIGLRNMSSRNERTLDPADDVQRLVCSELTSSGIQR